MPVCKRNGVWSVDVWVEIPGEGRQRLRKRAPVQTKKGALEYERQLVESVLSLSSRKEERRFSEFAVEFLENHVRGNLKYSTLVSYESVLAQHLIPFFGECPLDAIDEKDIAELTARLHKAGRTAKTVKNVLTVLSSLLHVAKTWKYIDRVPEVRFPKTPPTRFRFLSLEECLRLEGGSTPYWWMMIRLARTSGLRIGELCALEWEQVDLEDGSVRVDRAVWRGKVSSPKGNVARSVDLPPSTTAAFRAYEAERKKKGTLVFPNPEGRMREERKCDLGLRRSAKRAGLEPLGWHVLRHTYASHLVMKGVPIPVVQALLGHTDIRLTMRYAHLAPGQKIAAVVKLDEGVPENVGQYLVKSRVSAARKIQIVK